MAIIFTLPRSFLLTLRSPNMQSDPLHCRHLYSSTFANSVSNINTTSIHFHQHSLSLIKSNYTPSTQPQSYPTLNSHYQRNAYPPQTRPLAPQRPNSNRATLKPRRPIRHPNLASTSVSPPCEGVSLLLPHECHADSTSSRPSNNPCHNYSLQHRQPETTVGKLLARPSKHLGPPS